MAKSLDPSVKAFIPRPFNAVTPPQPGEAVSSEAVSSEAVLSEAVSSKAVSSKSMSWDPVRLRNTPVDLVNRDPIFHWSHGLMEVPICEEAIGYENALALIGIKPTRYSDPRPKPYMVISKANLNTMSRFLLELFKKGQFAIWHGMEAVPCSHTAETAWHVINSVQSQPYSPFDVIIPIGGDYDRSAHVVWIRVHIEWIGAGISACTSAGFRISYYRDSPKLNDPLQYTPYHSIESTIPLLNKCLLSQNHHNCILSLELEPMYDMGDNRLIEKLRNIVYCPAICHLIRWGGDGIMVIGCTDAYRNEVAKCLPTVMNRMPRGVRNILQLYVWFDSIGYVCIDVEFMRKFDANLEKPVFKITYFSI